MAAIVLAVLVVAGTLPGGPTADDCGAFLRPVSGPVVQPFAPKGSYAGHWGIDLEAELGSVVRAAASGTVTFAGVVSGMRSVTVYHGGGLRTSYSYLSAVIARQGRIERGSIVGLSGTDHGGRALHFSLRLHDHYLDPELVLGCIPPAPGPGLWLLPVGTGARPPS